MTVARWTKRMPIGNPRGKERRIAKRQGRGVSGWTGRMETDGYYSDNDDGGYYSDNDDGGYYSDNDDGGYYCDNDDGDGKGEGGNTNSFCRRVYDYLRFTGGTKRKRKSSKRKSSKRKSSKRKSSKRKSRKRKSRKRRGRK